MNQEIQEKIEENQKFLENEKFEDYLNGKILDFMNISIDESDSQFQIYYYIKKQDIEQVKKIVESDQQSIKFNKTLQMNPLHYSLYCKTDKISKFIIQQDIDLSDLANNQQNNIKISAYGIAIMTQNYHILQYLIPMKLIENESLNLFQLACLREDLKVVEYLLRDEKISKLIDFQNELTLQLSEKAKIKEILKNHRESKLQLEYLIKVQSEDQINEKNLFLGELFKLSNIFSRLKKRFIELDLITGTLTRYKKKSHYPLMPKQIIIYKFKSNNFFQNIKIKTFQIVIIKKKLGLLNFQFFYLKILENFKLQIQFKKFLSQINQKSGLPIYIQDIVAINQYNPLWFKKKDKFYFEIVTDKEKHVFFTQFESTMVKWICIILNAKKIHLSTSKQKENIFEIIDQPGNYLELPLNIINDIEKSWNLNYNEIISQEINLLSQSEYNDFVIDDQSVSFKSFEILKEIGRGAFGNVYLVEKKDDGQILALKTQQKKNLLLKKKLHYIISEAEIMKKLDHPFIMQMLYIFQTPLYIYFAMEYCPGIDLLKQLNIHKKFTEQQAKFYLCELVLAIQYLHSKNIIFRDLKPENILIDKQGHIKLTDFGLAKQNMKNKQNSSSICGTPAYVSPEILNHQGASQASDIYGIGGVLYELMVGEPPFLDYDLNTMFERIKEGQINFPKSLSQDSQDLITQLMNVDPTQRLGYNDFQEILNHKFFEDVNWADVYNKYYIPPIFPKQELVLKILNIIHKIKDQTKFKIQLLLTINLNNEYLQLFIMILRKFFTKIKNINFHSNILSQTEIVSTIQELFPNPDQIIFQQLKENPDNFYKTFKKQVYKMPTESLIKMTNMDFDQIQIWNLLQNEFQKRLRHMSIQDIAIMSKNLAINNKQNYSLFKDIENEILERQIDIPLDLVEMFLFSFSHTNLGSPLLFTHFYQTFNIGQYEIIPVKHALFAKYFQRSSSIQKGKVYKIVEQQILQYKDSLQFSDVLKIIENLFPYNIGSNDFQLQMEKLILQKYGNPTFSQLVHIIKYSCKHRFQMQSLVNKLYDDVELNLEYFSLEQLQTILWSVSKAKIQRVKLNEGLRYQFIKKIKLLNPRGLAFAVEGFTQIGILDGDLLEIIQNQIEIKMDQFQAHYLHKIIKNMILIDQDFTKQIIGNLKEKIVDLNISESIQFLQILMDNDPEEDLLDLFLAKFDDQYNKLNTLQKCQIFVYFARLGKYLKIDIDANDVPKDIFCQYIYTLINLKRWDKLDDFIPIIENLQTYGNLKYFFSHENFILLLFSVIILSQKNSRKLLQANFWNISRDAMQQINPNTLSQHTIQVYIQNIFMINKFTVVEDGYYESKIKEFDQNLYQKFLDQDINFNIDFEIKDDLKQYIVKFDQDCKINDLIDYQTYIDVSFVKDDKKYGIVIINDSHMIDKDQILTIFEIKYHNLSMQNWNLIFIVQEEWQQYSEIQKIEYLQLHF